MLGLRKPISLEFHAFTNPDEATGEVSLFFPQPVPAVRANTASNERTKEEIEGFIVIMRFNC